MIEANGYDSFATVTNENSTPMAHVEVDGEKLQELLESAEWKNLTPNANLPDTLLPADITFAFVTDLLTTIADPHVLAKFNPYEPPQGVKRVGENSTVKAVGSGERKHGYLVTTPKGKMVVLLHQDFDLPMQIPPDPHIYPYEELNNQSTYSDFRTYLSLPVMMGDKRFGIHLQEYGGTSTTSLTNKMIDAAMRKVARYVTARGMTVLDPADFMKEEHYVAANPLAAAGIIDIGVEARYKEPRLFEHYLGGQQRYITDRSAPSYFKRYARIVTQEAQKVDSFY